MPERITNVAKYSELRGLYKYHIDIFIALYHINTENEDDLNSIYKKIKAELIDSRKYLPRKIIKDILAIIPYNNRYTKSYLTLAKLILDDYHVSVVPNINPISNFLFYKEYGIKLDMAYFYINIYENLDYNSEDTIRSAIMNNDLERFIAFTERDDFDKNQKLESKLYPYSKEGYSLLELCCYHGAVDCFKFLRTQFKSEITQTCLYFSFLGGNQDIMSEFLKYQKPNEKCMKYAIISHNIDFVTFLMNENNLKIDLECCGEYNNLEALLVYFDQTHDIHKCLIYSSMLDIPSLCINFLSLGAAINSANIYHISNDDYDETTALHYAAINNNKELIEYLISKGAHIWRNTLLLAAINNSYNAAEVLLEHGIDVNITNEYGKTALDYAIKNNCRETIELLRSRIAKIPRKEEYSVSQLLVAAMKNIFPRGTDINKKDKNGQTALHIAAWKNNKEVAEILISHDANINEKDIYGKTALSVAAINNSEETAEVLILHGANINEKAKDGKTILHFATINKSKETIQLLLSHHVNVSSICGRVL
ncbi:hypothetical protein TVAG_308670 [Trichomonas vaginalis G3]|uniref:DUF3447 domain-containing protein n=1 Tax=Trichomonas vaginalis (strain ATCC PRA-98 / G3) TaxID=412133 RepID=A2FVG8_TRIV3|nr:protein ubiquitination [Trichomonas vaginalis G3]EAX91107.1 hypothetical protein TVAG_308670 [Trichomonas vaginalis G3]KAI5482252.1 protein ubiquitination [Trichomonas vaginalis G3]|eukprot:XP_001304037.1 hypothetical protein [Trichomonas vaginalis G3]